MTEQEHIKRLKKSKRLIGELSPKVVDFDGEILAGVRRDKAGWLRVYRVDTRKLAKEWEVPLAVAKEMIRTSSNIQRTVSKKETEASLLRMAEAFEKSGVPIERIATKIAEKVPYTDRYVRELLPDKYKMVQRTRKYEELVPHKPKVEVREYKPKETWEHRKAVMSPPVSKMDEAVYLALQQNGPLRNAGWTFEFQKHYCIKEVVSDITAKRGAVEKPLFVDGEVHVGREDRDEANRELLAHKLGIPKVFAFSYSGAYSDAKRDEILAKIVAALHERGLKF